MCVGVVMGKWIGGWGGGFDTCDMDQTLYVTTKKDFMQHSKRYSPEKK